MFLIGGANRGKSLLYIIPAAILIAVLCFAGFMGLRLYTSQKLDENKFAGLKELVPLSQTAKGVDEYTAFTPGMYDEVQKLNGDFAAWLTIPGTQIDYPVMKTYDDPQYYLRRGFDGEYSTGGCLFFGEGCDAKSRITIIYGHKMDSGTMFGELDSYSDPAFASEHKYVYIGTNEFRRKYRVFASFRTKLYSDDGYFKYYDTVGDPQKQEYDAVVGRIRSASVIDMADAPEYPAQIVYLSTCSYHTSNGRFVVAAYEVE